MRNELAEKLINTAKVYDIATNKSPEAVYEAFNDMVQVWAIPGDSPVSHNWENKPMCKGAFSKPCELVGRIHLLCGPLLILMCLDPESDKSAEDWNAEYEYLKSKGGELLEYAGLQTDEVGFVSFDSLVTQNAVDMINNLINQSHQDAVEELVGNEVPVIALSDKIYRGVYSDDGEAIIVVENEKDQKAGYNLRIDGRYSVTGFSWGYAGSGPAETAFCVLMDALAHMGGGAEKTALKLTQKFKFEVIAGLDMHRDWMIKGVDIERWVKSKVSLKGKNPRT